MKINLGSFCNSIKVKPHTQLQQLLPQFWLFAVAIDTTIAISPSSTGELYLHNRSAIVSQKADNSIVSPEKTIEVGVMAIRGVEETRQKWQPTLDYLSQRLLRLKKTEPALTVGQSIPEYKFQLIPLKFDNIEAAIANKLVDFALPNPGMYV